MPKLTTATLLGVLLVVTGLPAAGEAFEIRLQSGHVFRTRYEPEVAPFDESKILFMTELGNQVAVPESRVREIVSLVEAGGSTRLDAVTILIGQAPNDNLTPEEQAALEAEQGQLPAQRPIYSAPLISEPEATGGLPLQFLNFTTPPLGAAGAAGSAAALRRGGGSAQFAEPTTRD